MKNRGKSVIIKSGVFCPVPLCTGEKGGSIITSAGTERAMQKKRWTGMVAALFLLAHTAVCAGCSTGMGTETVTGVKIGKDGAVTATIVEAFDKEYYTEDGLAEMIQSEIVAYDSTGEKVSLIEIQKQEDTDQIVVVMRYASAEDYAAFNEVTFFYGTVEQAQVAGYMPDAALDSASGKEEPLQREDFSTLAEKHVVIFSEAMQVRLPSKILYLSSGSRLTDGKCAEAPENGALTYVITK